MFSLYRRFNYGGKYTAASTARFDAMLRRNDPKSGLRDVEVIIALAARQRPRLAEDNPMPANNGLLVLQK